MHSADKWHCNQGTCILVSSAFAVGPASFQAPSACPLAVANASTSLARSVTCALPACSHAVAACGFTASKPCAKPLHGIQVSGLPADSTCRGHRKDWVLTLL